MIVVDLGYGDAGKGTIVDWLCSPPARAGRSRRWSASTAAPRPRTTWSRPTAATHVRPVRLGHASRRAPGPSCPGSCSSTRSLWSPRRSTSPRLGVPDPLGLARDRPRRAARPRRTTGPRTRPGRRRAATAGTARAAWASARRPATRSTTRTTRRGPATSPPRAHCAASSPPLRDRRWPSELRPRSDGAVTLRRRGRRATGAFAAPGDPRRRRLPAPAAARPARSSSRAPRACCSTSGAASTRTPPGRRRRSTTRETLLRRGGRAPPLGSASSGPTRPGTAPARSPPRTRRCEMPEPHNAHGRWQGPFRDRAPGRGRAALRGRGRRRSRRGRAHPPGRRGPPPAAAVHVLPDRRAAPDPDHAGPGTRPGLPGAAHPLLLTARPGYEEPGDDWPAVVGGVTGAPVILGSHGPTAAAKRLLATSPR